MRYGSKRDYLALLVLLAMVLSACSASSLSQDDDDKDDKDGDASDGDGDSDNESGGDWDSWFPLPDGDDTPADGDATPNLCGVGDYVKSVTRNKIYYGTDTPELFNMSAGQQLALGALVSENYWGGYSNFCSGTLIAPKVVLTAAHCTVDIGNASQVKFAVGPDSANPTALLDVVQVKSNPAYEPYSAYPASHDTGILVLKDSALDNVSGIVPVPHNTTPLTRDLVGEQVQNGGFGATHNNSNNTRRYWVAEDIHNIYDAEFSVNGNGDGGVCFGDSGGPAFYSFDGQLRVIGTVSWGDESCVGIDHFASAEADKAWIESFIEATSDCGTLDETGQCAGDTAQWCENDKLKSVNCRENNQICGETEAELFRCVADPCEGLTFEGRCDEGEVARWCENGEIRFKNCAPCDQTCGWSGEALGYYCIDEPTDGDIDGDNDDTDPNDACRGISYMGCCNGEEALWCDPDTGTLRQEDCADYGQNCGWVDSTYGYFCGGQGSDPSGTNPIACP